MLGMTSCLGAKRGDECGGPPLADAGHFLQFDRICRAYGGDAAEPLQQSACCHCRDSGHRRQHRLSAGFGSTRLPRLSVCRTLAGPRTADSEPIEPESRVGGAIATQEANAKLDACQASAPDRGRAYRAGVEVGPLYEQKWIETCHAQASELGPESSRDQRSVQIVDAFSLHQHVAGQGIVAVGKTGSRDPRAQPLERLRYSARRLEDIGDDLSLVPNPPKVPPNLRLECKQLELLRSKSS